MGGRQTGRGRGARGAKAESVVADAGAGCTVVVRKGSSSAINGSFFPLSSEGRGSRALCSLE